MVEMATRPGIAAGAHRRVTSMPCVGLLLTVGLIGVRSSASSTAEDLPVRRPPGPAELPNVTGIN